VFDIVCIIAFRRYLAGGICNNTKRLHNQTIIITGSNIGIGKETARELLRRGAHVILACRTLAKAEDARRELCREGGKVEVRQLDLSNLKSIREFAAGIEKDDVQVHMLINNAGVMMCPYTETTDGFEMQMGTNHLGHFLLTNLLLPSIKKHKQPARIINLSSLAHLAGAIDVDNFNDKYNYDETQVYCNSKLANVLFTRELARQLKGTNIQVFSVHPGAVLSNLASHLVSSFVNNYLMGPLLKTTMQGAQTTIYCATEATQSQEMYFSDCSVGWAAPQAKDDTVAQQLWKHSSKLVGLATDSN